MITEESFDLETILVKYSNQKSIDKILNINLEDGATGRDNLMSEIQKANVEAIKGNGLKTKKRYIIKKAFKDENKLKTLEPLPLFKNEIYIYEHVLNGFEQLMDEYQDYNDKLWCDLIGYRPYDLIVLEDLQEKKFKLCQRLDMLDMNHTNLVMHNLGRFHGLGYALINRGVITKEKLGYQFLERDTPIMRHLTDGAIKTFSEVMYKEWPVEWKETATRLAKQEDEVFGKLKDLFKVNENAFNTIYHGDLWTCNLMFKYCAYDEKIPIAVKFLDYQYTSINSYIFDVISLLFNSVKPELRHNNFDQFLSIYQHSLQSTLAIYGLETKAPTLQQVFAEAKRIEYFAFVMSILNLTIQCAVLEEDFKMERLCEDYKKVNAFNPKLFSSDIFINGIKDDLKHWTKNGVL